MILFLTGMVIMKLRVQAPNKPGTSDVKRRYHRLFSTGLVNVVILNVWATAFVYTIVFIVDLKCSLQYFAFMKGKMQIQPRYFSTSEELEIITKYFAQRRLVMAC